jgi:hypothetical protein
MQRVLALMILIWGMSGNYYFEEVVVEGTIRDGDIVLKSNSAIMIRIP